ncbi:MAG: hypothetical protein ACO1SX_20435, partial [Actinomycetota bacterium]
MRVVVWKPAPGPSCPPSGLLLGFALVTLLAVRLLPVAAATFTVTTTADGVPGSLRQAIEAANAAPGADTILFRIPLSDPGFAGGVFTLRPTSELPAVQGPTLVDGYSQIGFTGNSNPNGPEIVINGALAGDAVGLNMSGPDSLVRGLVLNGFAQEGLAVGGDRSRVEGCYIGADAAGSGAVPNGSGGGSGGGLSLGGADVQVGGTDVRSRNVISGNNRYGISMSGGRRVVILGNYIGVNAAGTAAVPNGSTGLFLQNGLDCRVGGAAAGSRNLISGNGESGIVWDCGGGNLVQGNYIGTDARGEYAIPNGDDGVIVTQISSVVVGGTTSAARNVISGNSGDGVEFVHTGANNQLLGNYIGLNAAGTAALPNQGSGVRVTDCAGQLIGGTASGARNIISGNGGNGISVDLDAEDNLIRGNYIGANPVGRAAIPNQGHGVFIADGSQWNRVGGAGAGEGNLISGNARDGVRISGETVFDQLPPDTAFNVVLGNRIGTDYSGDRALPNGENGVTILEGGFAGARENTIGGNTNGARNVISGNNGPGISIDNVSSLTVQGNYIGTNAAGTAALANSGSGILVDVGLTNSL